MLTWMRGTWARVRLAWRLVWNTRQDAAHLYAIDQIDRLLSSVTMAGATWATRKTAMDASLKGAQYNQVRAETVEWTKAYCAERGVVPTSWQLRVCIELAVGRAKGYL
jgi:hypothetical protein